MKIWFDMDGTIADLYGVENWLPKLRAEDPSPYKEARPLLNLQALARVLNNLQAEGFELGVISWTSKGGSKNYNRLVKLEKEQWLRRHLKTVSFNSIRIIDYGTPKENFMESLNDILFDDEEKNRINWKGAAYDEKNIIKVLKSL